MARRVRPLKEGRYGQKGAALDMHGLEKMNVGLGFCLICCC
jgi:hypothetical protein